MVRDKQVLRKRKVRKRAKGSVPCRLHHLVLEFHGCAAACHCGLWLVNLELLPDVPLLESGQAIVDDPVYTKARRDVECKPPNHEGQKLEDLLSLLLGRVVAGRGLEQLLADALRHDQDDRQRKVGCCCLPSESRVSVARIKEQDQSTQDRKTETRPNTEAAIHEILNILSPKTFLQMLQFSSFLCMWHVSSTYKKSTTRSQRGARVVKDMLRGVRQRTRPPSS